MARAPKLHGFSDDSAAYRPFKPGPVPALEDEARTIIKLLAIIEHIAS